MVDPSSSSSSSSASTPADVAGAGAGAAAGVDYKRLIRFLPITTNDEGAKHEHQAAEALIGEPVDPNVDVGLALYPTSDPSDGNGKEEGLLEAYVFSGTSILSPGHRLIDASTGQPRRVKVGRVLSPLAAHEVGGGAVRCIGLNYVQHAHEVNLDLPKVPIVFLKPSTSLGDPYPAPTPIPRAYVDDDAADYEAELAVIIGTTGKNIAVADAMHHVAGYTASNDVSSRLQQFATSQWCYSKGFDGACPLGPAFVPKEAVGDVGKMHIRGIKNGKVMQESGLDDLIFSIPHLVSFLSQGTTLPAGTVILTGTPHGIGWSTKPEREVLRNGDEFRVEVSHGVGTLINKIVVEE